jgi:hypothetical protein
LSLARKPAIDPAVAGEIPTSPASTATSTWTRSLRRDLPPLKLSNQERERVVNLVRNHMRLLGRPPGPIIGEVLRRLLERVLDDASLNTREQLEALVPEVAKEVR